MKKLWMMVAVVVALATGCGTEMKDADRASSVRTERVTPPAVVTTEASSEVSMSEWVDDNAFRLMDMSVSLDNMANADGPLEMSVACESLRDAVDSAMAADPMPDRDVNAPYQSALREFRLGADACIDGIEYMDADALDEALAHMAQGTEFLEDASTALEGSRS